MASSKHHKVKPVRSGYHLPKAGPKSSGGGRNRHHGRQRPMADTGLAKVLDRRSYGTAAKIAQATQKTQTRRGLATVAAASGL